MKIHDLNAKEQLDFIKKDIKEYFFLMREKLNSIEKDLNSKDHTRQAAAIMYSAYLKECIGEIDNKIDLAYEKIMDQETAQFSVH